MEWDGDFLIKSDAKKVLLRFYSLDKCEWVLEYCFWGHFVAGSINPLVLDGLGEFGWAPPVGSLNSRQY